MSDQEELLPDHLLNIRFFLFICQIFNAIPVRGNWQSEQLNQTFSQPKIFGSGTIYMTNTVDCFVQQTMSVEPLTYFSNTISTTNEIPLEMFYLSVAVVTEAVSPLFYYES